jgi:hypothetical protein
MVNSITSSPYVFQSSASYFEKLPKCLTSLVKRIFEATTGYFLKVSVFSLAAFQGRFSKWIIAPVVLTVTNFWKRVKGISQQHAAIDSKRLENGAAFLREFAEVRTLTTPGGKVLPWVCYRPEKFEQWIRANGGIRIGERIFPRQPGDWQRLKRLGEFKWFEQVGHSFRIPAPVTGAQQICVLRCQGFGRTMTMDKNFIGLHLAAGFNYAIFDWGKEVSIKSYFQDAEGGYQAALREGFSPSQIKIMGSCRATFPISYLKEQHHAEGVDAVLIQPPPSLREMIATYKPPANWIGQLSLGAVEKDGEHFDSVRRFRSLRPSSGRLCLVMSEGDKTLPENTADQFRNAASHAGPFEIIWDPKDNSGSDPHFAEPLRKPPIFERYTQFLVSR